MADSRSVTSLTTAQLKELAVVHSVAVPLDSKASRDAVLSALTAAGVTEVSRVEAQTLTRRASPEKRLSPRRLDDALQSVAERGPAGAAAAAATPAPCTSAAARNVSHAGCSSISYKSDQPPSHAS